MLICLLFNVIFAGSRASAQEVSATFEVVKPALALLSYSEQGDIHFGTAFCIQSTAAASYFLTNKHVVGSRKTVDVNVLSRPGRTFDGTIVAQSAVVDAAIVRVEVGSIKTLKLASSSPRVGQPVSIVGFPLFQLRYLLSSHSLAASVHSGIVNALLFDGAYIEYDAQTDKGSSGGPIVDSGNGRVYGLVTYVFPGASRVIQNNIGVSVSDLSELLARIKFAHAPPAVPSTAALKSAQAFFSSAAASQVDVSGQRP